MNLFIDTETTGLPHGYCDISEQPYVVQIAAILCDDARRPVAQVNRLIRPEGWTIPSEAQAIHGFSTSYCRLHGISLREAMDEVLPLWCKAERIVAYNISFDLKMLQFSAQRERVELPSREMFCAMKASSQYINGGGRWMKLAVAYHCFFGREFENEHDAMADVRACMEIYFALQDTVTPVAQVAPATPSVSATKLQKTINATQEVEEFQEHLDSIIQLHRRSLKPIDWNQIASQPIPPAPTYSPTDEMAAKQTLDSYRPNIVMRWLELDADRIARLEQEVEEARARDQQRFAQTMKIYKAQQTLLEQSRRLARHVLAGDQDAYHDVMDHHEIGASPLLARKLVYSFAGTSSVEAFGYLNGIDVIPEQTKTLLASGRVSVKKTNKTAFLGLYQDHLCSAALRIARDFMALLPIEKVLVHGFVSTTDPATGAATETCFLSCAFTRSAFNGILFDRIDPSDCVESFPHAMVISKGKFQEVAPLSI